MESISFNLTSILTLIGSIITPFVLKLLKSSNYRNQFIRAFKLIINGLLGRANLNHYLFNNAGYYKSIAKGVIFHNCPNKTNLFYLLLNTKINSVITNSLDFINNNRGKLKKMNKLELRGELSLLVSNIVQEYESRTPEEFYTYLENKKTANKAWDLIYNGNDKYVGFKEYHQHNLNPVLKYIDNIPLYSTSTNEQLVYHLFGLFDTSLFTAIQDLRDRFKHINGELKNL